MRHLTQLAAPFSANEREKESPSVGRSVGCARLLAPPRPHPFHPSRLSLGLSLPSPCMVHVHAHAHAHVVWATPTGLYLKNTTPPTAQTARDARALHLDRLSRTSQPFTGQRRCVCVLMPLLSMYINNKAGGLIYQRVRTCRTSRNRRPPSDLMPHPALAQDFGSNAGATTSNKEVNDHLLLASTFNSLAMILKELSPVPHSSKMRTLALP